MAERKEDQVLPFPEKIALHLMAHRGMGKEQFYTQGSSKSKEGKKKNTSADGAVEGLHRTVLLCISRSINETFS